MQVLYKLWFTFLRHCYEEFEDTKGVIRIRKLKKDGQHIGQKKKDNLCMSILIRHLSFLVLKDF